MSVIFFCTAMVRGKLTWSDEEEANTVLGNGAQFLMTRSSALC